MPLSYQLFGFSQHDAFFLAKMPQLGILPEGYIFPKYQ
jgi:hypothetical protein